MTTASPREARLRVPVEDLCEVLERLRHLHERLLAVLTEKEQVLVEVRLDHIDGLREREEEILREVIDQEKERLLLTEELGDLLDHESPVNIRVGEILLNLSGDLAQQLSSRRESLREVAFRLAKQNSLNRALIEHSIDHIQLFLSRVAREEEGGARYDCTGTSHDSGGGPFLMDRRV